MSFLFFYQELESMDGQNIPQDVILEVIEGVDKGKIFTITAKTITIGRNEACELQLNDEYVSKKHCQIVFRDDHFTVMDLNSLNKTKINDDDHIQKNLNDGDVLSLGKTKIKFCWKDQDAIYKWYK